MSVVMRFEKIWALGGSCGEVVFLFAASLVGCVLSQQVAELGVVDQDRNESQQR